MKNEMWTSAIFMSACGVVYVLVYGFMPMSSANRIGDPTKNSTFGAEQIAQQSMKMQLFCELARSTDFWRSSNPAAVQTEAVVFALANTQTFMLWYAKSTNLGRNSLRVSMISLEQKRANLDFWENTQTWYSLWWSVRYARRRSFSCW